MDRIAKPKPLKGAALLERRQRRAELEAHERTEMQAAKKRDRYQCRWPACEYRLKDMPIDGAHFLQHRGMAGNPNGERTRRDLIISLCRCHHGMLDRGMIAIEPLTEANADGPCAFYARPSVHEPLVRLATEAR